MCPYCGDRLRSVGVIDRVLASCGPMVGTNQRVRVQRIPQGQIGLACVSCVQGFSVLPAGAAELQAQEAEHG